MKAKRLFIVALAPLLASGCQLFDPSAPDAIAGRYAQLTHDGRALPTIIQGAAEGDRVVLVAGELELRRNFSWVLRQRVDSIRSGAARAAVLADSGNYRFDVEPNELSVFTSDAFPHPVHVSGDTLDVHWRFARHDLFAR